jgi:hypothetical protein
VLAPPLQAEDKFKRNPETIMPDDIWINLSTRERSLILDALTLIRGQDRKLRSKIDALSAKLTYSAPFPNITVGVEGGQVQWTSGNPFPIRICDYDGQGDDDLPDVDERGRRCRAWVESADVPGSERPSARR